MSDRLHDCGWSGIECLLFYVIFGVLLSLFVEYQFHCLWVERLHGGQFKTLYHVDGALLVFLKVVSLAEHRCPSDVGHHLLVADDIHQQLIAILVLIEFIYRYFLHFSISARNYDSDLFTKKCSVSAGDIRAVFTEHIGQR